jgi:thiosulfate reductase cytochrome b subunit
MRAKPDTVVLHSRWVRYTHWTWALGVLVLIGSGWRIYNQEPLFEFLRFPVWLTLGGDYDGAERVHNDIGLAGALLWHFAAMWLLFFSIMIYTMYGIVSGHFRRSFTPIWPRKVVDEISDFLRGKLDHELGVRNSVQKLLYTFAVLCMLLMVWSGLVLWKPLQFEKIGVPLGNYEGARYIHFFGMAGLVGFIIVHVILTLLVPKVLPPMITGRALATAVRGAAHSDPLGRLGEHS